MKRSSGPRRSISLLVAVIAFGLTVSCTSARQPDPGPSPTPSMMPTERPMPTYATAPEPDCLAIRVDRATIKVGEVLIVTGTVGKIGGPEYYILVKDREASEFSTLAKKSFLYDDLVSNSDASRILALDSIRADSQEVVATLRGQAAGSTEVAVKASGEYYCGGDLSSASFTTAVVTESIAITVNP